MEIIESKENKLIEFLKKLKQKKYRDAEGQFLAEGHKSLTSSLTIIISGTVS